MSTPPAAQDPLDRPLATARITGLTTSVATKLAKGLDIHTVRDLLEHVPRRYIDLSKTASIGELKINEEATTRGKVARVDGRHLRSRRHILTVTISDGTGYLELLWWNQPFRERAFVLGREVVVAGRVERDKRTRRIVMTNPFYESLTPGSGEGVHVGRVIPIHSTTNGVSTTQLRRYVHDALQKYGNGFDEPLPPEIAEGRSLVPRARAIRELHFPTNDRARYAARYRLAFEELFVLSTGLAVRKRRIESQAAGIRHEGGSKLVEKFLGSLPFQPTGAQRRAIEDILGDLARPHPMNRLLQGEVGSGKTVVALAAAIAASVSGSQTAFMAPTEVLAEQHYLTVRRLLEPLRDDAPVSDGRLFGEGFEVALLTGSVTGRERERALDAAASGRAMLLVGTHALIQSGVSFHRLGCAVIDEQHRFGVHQRVSLRAKGGENEQPDVLIMTATPIPRTLALTLYGDLDVSTLDEMPPGRTPVETNVVYDELARARAYKDIRNEIAQGRQAFIVCPLVEESSNLEVKAAESEFDRIRSEVFPELRVGLIHGRMKSQAKDEVMREMRDGNLDVLVATTVIEVGVDIPNASVMVIEDADRFGLSQLHQLRGRIGRGAAISRCYLFTNVTPSDEADRADALRRLSAMESTTDGLKLAELDLELRGTGHLLGRGTIEEGKGAPLQTGRGDLRFANLVRDLSILEEARRDAFTFVDADPSLGAIEHRALLLEVRRRFADRLDWLFAS